MSKKIVLTGATRGLGRALVARFAAEGHVVIGCGRSEPHISELRTRYAAPHAFETVDVAREDAVARWAERVLASHGAPDLVVNNAGLINASAPLWEVPAGELSRVVDVNLKGTASVIRAFAPSMIERGAGVIVNMSSGWGRSTSPEVAPYCATKWAVEGLTRALAQELPPGLAAMSLNPGVIHTEMLESCFGELAAGYESADEWAGRAAPFLVGLDAGRNGEALTAP